MQALLLEAEHGEAGADPMMARVAMVQALGRRQIPCRRRQDHHDRRRTAETAHCHSTVGQPRKSPGLPQFSSLQGSPAAPRQDGEIPQLRRRGPSAIADGFLQNRGRLNWRPRYYSEGPGESAPLGR
jgi:hypothetical protein